MKRTLTIVALVLMATAGFSQQVASRAKAMRMMSFSRPEYLIKDIKETLGDRIKEAKASRRLRHKPHAGVQRMQRTTHQRNGRNEVHGSLCIAF